MKQTEINQEPKLDKFGTRTLLLERLILHVFPKILLINILIYISSCFAYALEVPEISTRITDKAGILSSSFINNFEKKLQQFEQKTGVQIAIMILPSLEGESLEDFSLKIVEKAKLGQKGRDNGVLFLMVMQERLMRIEVGYGLEAQIPDARTRKIQENAKQYFRSGDFEGGIALVISKLMTFSNPENKEDLKKHDNTLIDKKFLIYLILFLLVLFVLIPITGLIILPLIYKSSNAMLGAPFGIVGIIFFGFALIIFKLFLRTRLGHTIKDQMYSSSGLRRRSGFGGWGGFGGGGFGSGGFGSGGFGGGGGGFGGGGSSSNW